MVNVFRSYSSVQLPAENYVEDAVTDRIEQSIADSLPALAGLSSALLTSDERVAVFESAAAAAFIKFTLYYGSPFGGCSANSVQTMQPVNQYHLMDGAKKQVAQMNGVGGGT